jgi:hypothetical protein
MGVYPPDVISRLGRLLDILEIEDLDNSDIVRRVLDAVAKTKGGPMDKLGKPSWFSKTKEKEAPEGSLFYFIKRDGEMPKIQQEACYSVARERYVGAHPDLVGVDNSESDGGYWTHWKRIDDWDNEFVQIMNNTVDDNPIERLNKICAKLDKLTEKKKA